MLDYLKKTVREGRERIAALEHQRLELIRQSHEQKVLRQIHERKLVRQNDEAAWRRVELKLDAALRRWKGEDNA